MGTVSPSPAPPHHIMIAAPVLLLASIAVTVNSHGFYHHGYHVPHVKCSRGLETVTKEHCRIDVEKECVTKTKTFVKITGYEDTDCKEIEVCKHALPPHPGHFWRKRAAEAEADPHGYYVECEKEMKTICKKKPVTEEVSKDFELCRPKPTRVCEEKELKVPTVVCEEPEAEAEEAEEKTVEEV